MGKASVSYTIIVNMHIEQLREIAVYAFCVVELLLDSLSCQQV